MRLSKYVISVSKRHKNNHAGVKNGAWCIYYYDDDWKLQQKRINPLLVPFYKLTRYHRIKNRCLECGVLYLSLINWRDKDMSCPYCGNDFVDLDDFEND